MSEGNPARWIPAEDIDKVTFPAIDGVEPSYDISEPIVETHLEDELAKPDREHDEVEVLVVEPRPNKSRRIDPDDPSVGYSRDPVYVRVQFWETSGETVVGEKTTYSLKFVDGFRTNRVTDGEKHKRPISYEDDKLTANRTEATKLVIDAVERAGYQFVRGD